MLGPKGWWQDDLGKVMNSQAFCDYQTIHRFDPPREHFGGGGNAQQWLTLKGDAK